jgi:hypothetical protein
MRTNGPNNNRKAGCIAAAGLKSRDITTTKKSAMRCHHLRALGAPTEAGKISGKAIWILKACRMGPEGVSFDTPLSRSPWRPVSALDQDQEPEQPGDAAGNGLRITI